jgi:hypothetical protein
MMILEVFKRTWSEVRKERNEAKKARKEVEILLKQAKNTVSAIDEAYNSLSKVYSCLPEEERMDFVQKTLDLLKFTGIGHIKNVNQTAYTFYNKLYSDYSSDYDLKLMYRYWKAKDWKNVVVVCERLKENINNSRDVYVRKNEEKAEG